MSRSLRHRAITAAVIGTLGTMLAAGAATANSEPKAVIQGRTAVTAHVTGEKSGNRCQIAGKNLAGPWAVVDKTGAADLTLGPLRPNGKHIRVICEDPKRGDSSLHTVRSDRVTYDGALSPLRQILNSTFFGQ
ncbi:hypothetical protein OHB26_07655 [Nocardia sp. NBC_01503]|uniref:hypothetical protein n=1 Tax=Nocardia sp. NBC_01503 TaxID=2975997 RepID=UPI002E7AE40C|nr:hypothetical protein [Nocardia sp. NBC_01503]WTL34080.1 hypothetical protein OHB26_07655 [Nocardia sp. NBC_01503]